MNPAKDSYEANLDLSEALHSRGERYMLQGNHVPERVSHRQRNQLERDINRKASFGRRGNGKTVQFTDVDGVDYRVYQLNGQVFAQDVYRAIPPVNVCSNPDDLPKALSLLKVRISRQLGDFVKKMADKGYSS